MGFYRIPKLHLSISYKEFFVGKDVLAMMKRLSFVACLGFAAALMIIACGEQEVKQSQKTMGTQVAINRILKEAGELKGEPAALAGSAEALLAEAQSLRESADSLLGQADALSQKATSLEERAQALSQKAELLDRKLSAIQGSASTLGELYLEKEKSPSEPSGIVSTTTVLIVIIVLIVVLLVYIAVRRRRLEQEEEERLAAIRRQQAVYTPAAPAEEEKEEEEKGETQVEAAKEGQPEETEQPEEKSS